MLRGRTSSSLAPRDVRALAALVQRPIVAVDVGCRDGVREAWRALGPTAVLVGFDPDPAECARLNAAARGPAEERYESLALAASPAELTLHLTADPQSSSLYPPNPHAIRRFPELWRHEQRDTEAIVATTLDAWAADTGIGAIDALKVDVQGAELDVLRGAGSALASVRVLETEVEFQELYAGQPVFTDVDSFLRERGFELWRLREIHHCGLQAAARAEPVFGVGDYVEHTRLGGQIAWANAIFVRGELADLDVRLDWQVRVRDACLAAIFGFPELVELALGAAAATAPEPARATIAGVLSRARRRGSRRRVEDLVRRAPAHVRGFWRARIARA